MKCFKKLEPFQQSITAGSIAKAKQRLLFETVTTFLFAKWTSTHIRIQDLRCCGSNNSRKIVSNEDDLDFLPVKALVDSLSLQDLNAICPVTQNTLLNFSILKNDKILFDYLLERGASLFIACQGETILDTIISNHRMHWLKDKFWLMDPLFESLIDVSNLKTSPSTPLITAVINSDKETFQWLLEKGANLKRSTLLLKNQMQIHRDQFKCYVTEMKMEKEELEAKAKAKKKVRGRDKGKRNMAKETKTKLSEVKKMKISKVRRKRKVPKVQDEVKNTKKNNLKVRIKVPKVEEEKQKRRRRTKEKKMDTDLKRKKEEEREKEKVKKMDMDLKEKEEEEREKEKAEQCQSLKTNESIDDQSLFGLPHSPNVEFDMNFIPDNEFLDSLLQTW